MKFMEYLKDKVISFFLLFFTLFIICLMLVAFKCQIQIMIGIIFTIILCFDIGIVYDYYKKRKFYDFLLNNLELLDKKYLINEMIYRPSFYEGKILFDSLYEINKSMNEEIKKYSLNLQDFKEYIEMWIHEVKLPLSSINLIVHNHKELSNKKMIEQLKRIDDDVEQVLYYVRSENAEKDYLINDTNLKKVISNIAIKNKDILLEKNIEFIAENTDINVLTDSKWLEFIVGQIISNSIKYMKDNKDSYIKISTVETENEVSLKVYDNGIGISNKDIVKVFDKTFTGHNGRKIGTSTGMGLYIVKKLCNKLGHKIRIASQENEFTEVEIIFNKNNFFDVLK